MYALWVNRLVMLRCDIEELGWCLSAWYSADYHNSLESRQITTSDAKWALWAAVSSDS
jgi:hypothetical protein